MLKETLLFKGGGVTKVLPNSYNKYKWYVLGDQDWSEMWVTGALEQTEKHLLTSFLPKNLLPALAKNHTADTKNQVLSVFQSHKNTCLCFSYVFSGTSFTITLWYMIWLKCKQPEYWVHHGCSYFSTLGMQAEFMSQKPELFELLRKNLAKISGSI